MDEVPKVMYPSRYRKVVVAKNAGWLKLSSKLWLDSPIHLTQLCRGASYLLKSQTLGGLQFPAKQLSRKQWQYRLDYDNISIILTSQTLCLY